MAREQQPVDYRGTTVLITGASSGLGAEFARHLARRGADLVLVARRRARLEDLAQRLHAEHGVQVTVIEADLSTPDAAVSLVTELEAREIRVDSLINNAGFGMAGPFADSDAGQLHDMVALNVATLTDLTHVLLPQLVDGGRGVLVNVASAAAYQPLPGMAAYGASKAYVLSLTEAIAYETRKSGLRVLALSPGPTRTEFFDVAGNDKAGVGRFQTATEVVDTALDALDRKRPWPSVVSGRMNAISAALVGALPRRLVLHVAARVVR